MSFARRAPGAFVALALGAGCDEVPPARTAPPRPAGLTRRIADRQQYAGGAQTAGHLGEVVPVPPRVYVANSADWFGTWRTDVPEGLRVMLSRPSGDCGGPCQCTTLAHHPASATMFCGDPFSPRPLMSFDLARPDDPALRDRAPLDDPRLHPRDLYVDGDTLLVASFDEGLLAADIAPDGSLSRLRRALAGDVRFVSGDGGRLAALDRDRGLLRLRRAGETLAADGALALDGPRINLTVRGRWALVALGSEGASVVDLDAALPTEITRLRPPGVVTAADRAGDLVAVACTSGVYLYDLSVAPPRVRGFSPAGWVMLDARFIDGEVVASDWEALARLAVRADGRVLTLDGSWGSYHAGDEATVALRNPGDEPLSASFLGPPAIRGVTRVPPGGVVRLALDPAWTRALAPPRQVEGSFSTFADDGASTQDPRIRVAFRAPDSPALPPAEGEPMPPLTLPTPGGGTLALPLPGTVTRLVFYTYDCAAMWPELEDLDHLARVGATPDGEAPVFIDIADPTRSGVVPRWRLDASRHAFTQPSGEDEPAAVRDTRARLGDDPYERSFLNSRIRGGAHHPTDYVVDARGAVLRVERLYRGRHPLR